MTVALPSAAFRIHDLVRKHLPHAAHRPAIVDGERIWTYQDLYSDALLLSEYLRDAGLRAGDRLMVVGENGAAQMLALLAASLNDAWAVMTNARLTSTELAQIEHHCAPRMVLYTSDVSKDALRHAQAHSAQEQDLNGLIFFCTKANPNTTPEEVHTDSAEQVAVLIYTSGSTGQPKGVMLTHRNLGYSAAVSAHARSTSMDDDVYAPLPMSHVFGLTSVVLSAISAGAKVRLMAKFDAHHAAQALADGVSFFLGVPTMYVRMLALRDEGVALQAPRLRFIQCGGAPMDAALKEQVEAMFGLPVNNGYGMTEASPSICMMPFNQYSDDLTVGYLIPRLEARIVDAQDRDVQPNAVGELKIRGPNVTKGYYRAPEQTAEVLSTDGWLATGDLVRRAEDGRFYVMGRNKDLIIRSGFNVYPAEVEAALNAHPAVAHSCVVGRSVAGDEEVIAYVELQAPALTDEQTLHAFVRERLAPYKRPQRIVLTPQLPTTQAGKILKQEIQTLAERL